MRTIDGDAFSDWLKEYGQEYIHGKKKISLMNIWKHVQDMPTIEPKKGKWIWSDEDASWKCGKCDCVFEEIDWKPEYNFCPNCGADMREGETDD